MLSSLVTWYRWRHALPALMLLLALVGSMAGLAQAEQDQEGGQRPDYVIAGRLIDGQNQPVPEAHISAQLPDREKALGESESQEDGNWRLALEEEPVPGLQIVIERPHFESEVIVLGAAEVVELIEDGIFGLGELELQRKVTAGFWAATFIFAGVLVIIALEKLHSTTAALAGISAVFLVSFAAERSGLTLVHL